MHYVGGVFEDAPRWQEETYEPSDVLAQWGAPCYMMLSAPAPHDVECEGNQADEPAWAGPHGDSPGAPSRVGGKRRSRGECGR